MTKHHQWTEQELSLLGTVSDKKVAEQLGLPVHTVARKSRILGLTFQKQEKWSAEHVALLGTASDSAVAKLVGRKRMTVYFARRERGISAFHARKTPKPTPVQSPQAKAPSDWLAWVDNLNNTFRLHIGDSSIELSTGQAKKLQRLMQSLEITERQKADPNQADWVGGK